MDTDEDITESFLREAQDLLQGLGDSLMEMEAVEFKDIEDQISKGFRQIHTVKGSAGFLGFRVIESLSHAMENLLALARSGEKELNRHSVTLLLEGTRKLEECVEIGLGSNDFDISNLIEAFKKTIQTSDVQIEKLAVAKTTSWPFAKELLEEMANDELVWLLWSVQSLDPNTVETIRKEVTTIGDIVEELFDKSGHLYLLIRSVLDHDMIKMCTLDFDFLVERPHRNMPTVQLSVFSNESAKLQHEEPSSTIVPPPKVPSSGKPSVKKAPADTTIRVKVNLLEDLMGLASELVLSRNQVMSRMDKDAKNRFNVLAGQITELQDSVMKLRLQPLQTVFSKVPRMVRELSNQLGKEVQIDIRGKDVELDRTMVDSLSDPLTHIIRNSLDHGMETASERVKLGKPPAGTVRINAYSQGGDVHIDISDDGKGIDPVIVSEKAVEKNVISKEDVRRLSDEEKQALIFSPGFSTAQSVSSVSGRGVGMDVVRSKIEELGGKVLLFSKKGEGTMLRLLLPISLAVVPALIVECNKSIFAIPRVSISELVLVEGTIDNRIEKMGDRSVYRLREEILSVVHLEQALSGHSTFRDPETGEWSKNRRQPGERRVSTDREALDRRSTSNSYEYLIVMKAGPAKFGVIVDLLHPPEEIVVKPLPSYCLDCKHFSGVSILGNGKVVPIVNPLELANRAKISLTEDLSRATEQPQTGSATHYWVIVKSEQQQYAIPQQLVRRIDEIHGDTLQWVDEQYFVVEGDSTIPLILVSELEQSWAPTKNIEKGYMVVPKYLPIEIGFYFDKVVGIVDSKSKIERTQKSDLFMGKVIINGILTKIVDVYGMTGKAMPELQHMRIEEENTVKEKTNLKILVAEDSPIFTSIMKKTIAELGFKANFVADGVEAYDELLKNKYDILLSDLEMPNLDGFGLLEQLKKSGQLNGLITVALTGNQDIKMKELALNKGFHHFMIKFDKKKLGDWLSHQCKIAEGAA